MNDFSRATHAANCVALVLMVFLNWPVFRAAAQQGSGFKFLEVKVVDPEGKPAADASVEVTLDGVSFPMPTDERGMISLNVPAGGNTSLQLRVEKEGFAAISASWSSGEEIPTELEIPLQPGVEIGGIVHDEDGNPVEGVAVEAVDYVRQPLPGRMQASLGGQIGLTDAEGRWRYSGAAEQHVNAYLHLSHPDYANDNNRHGVTYEKLRSLDHLLVLKKGIELRGTITDPEGNRVEGAKVALGSNLGQKDQTRETNAKGEYLFGNLPAAQTVITVYSPNFAPELKVVAAHKGMEPVDFQLRKGKPMRIRVTDPDGKPIQGVGVVADTWRGQRTLYQLGMPERTDENGLCIWENAPEDEMSYDIWHGSHMSLRNQLLTAGGAQLEIELGWPLVVAGSVVDAETGKPIELFNAIQGIRWNANNSEVYWERYNMQAGQDGKFQLRFTEPREAHLVRIEAHGYRPAVSREIRDEEGEVTLEFKLEPGSGPSGVVRLTDGSPAADAVVVMASTGGQINMNNGEYRQQDQATRVVADDQGRYQLPFPDSDYAVVFLHDGGWAQYVGSALEASPNVMLNQWARLEGTVQIGNQAAANESVNLSFSENNYYNQSGPRVYWSHSAQTDAEGAFVFERLKSGDATVGRMITFGDDGSGRYRMSTYSHSIPVILKSGETTEVQIGGTGRQIKGKVVVPDDYEGPIAWSMGQVSVYEQTPAASGASGFFFHFGKALAEAGPWGTSAQIASPPQPVVRRSYATAINEQGEFEIDDVLPGKYALNVMVYEPPTGENYSYNMLGTANSTITVPEEGDSPVEVGEHPLQIQARSNTQSGTFELRATPVAE